MVVRCCTVSRCWVSTRRPVEEGVLLCTGTPTAWTVHTCREVCHTVTLSEGGTTPVNSLSLHTHTDCFWLLDSLLKYVTSSIAPPPFTLSDHHRSPPPSLPQRMEGTELFSCDQCLQERISRSRRVVTYLCALGVYQHCAISYEYMKCCYNCGVLVS